LAGLWAITGAVIRGRQALCGSRALYLVYFSFWRESFLAQHASSSCSSFQRRRSMFDAKATTYTASRHMHYFDMPHIPTVSASRFVSTNTIVRRTQTFGKLSHHLLGAKPLHYETNVKILAWAHAFSG
jgi:hypothetical protein